MRDLAADENSPRQRRDRERRVVRSEIRKKVVPLHATPTVTPERGCCRIARSRAPARLGEMYPEVMRGVACA